MGKGSCKRLRSINASVTRGPYPAQAGSYLIIFYKGLNVLSNLGLDPTTPRRRAPGAAARARSGCGSRRARSHTRPRHPTHATNASLPCQAAHGRGLLQPTC